MRVEPTPEQLRVIRWYNGDPEALDGFRLPSMETVEACADQGWLVRLEGPPFFRASEAGRTIVWQAGAFG
jgi:hypothetical protein